MPGTPSSDMISNCVGNNLAPDQSDEGLSSLLQPLGNTWMSHHRTKNTQAGQIGICLSFRANLWAVIYECVLIERNKTAQQRPEGQQGKNQELWGQMVED